MARPRRLEPKRTIQLTPQQAEQAEEIMQADRLKFSALVRAALDDYYRSWKRRRSAAMALKQHDKHR